MLDSVAVLDPAARVLDANGDPVSGAKLKFYLAGTSTPLAVYADSALSASLGSTVTCDSGGYPTSDGSTKTLIWTGTADYKVVVTDADDVTIATHDNIDGAIASSSLGGAGTGVWDTPVTTLAVDTTLGSSHYGKLVQSTPSAAVLTHTLPSSVTAGDGARIGIRHAASTQQTVVKTQGGQTIKRRGATVSAATLAGLGHTIWFVSDGANWTADIEIEPLGGSIVKIADRLTAAPSSPTGGARYILNGTPTGTWLTLGFTQHQIVEADGQGGWLAYTPFDGWLAYVGDENLYTAFVDTAWVDQTGMTSPSTAAVWMVQDVRAQNTAGGTNVANAWTAVPALTQVVAATGCSITSGARMRFPVGTWNIVCTKSFFATGLTRLRLYNLTTSTVVYVSDQNTFPIISASGTSGTMTLQCPLTVTDASHEYEVQYFTANAQTSNGLGVQLNVAGESERYCTIIALQASRGPAGAAGAQGNTGRDAGVGRWTFSTSTTSGPSTGTLRLNHATIASATALYIHETDADGNTLGPVIASMDDSTSTIRGYLTLRKQDAPGTWALFAVTGAVVDNGSDDTLTIAYVTGNGSFSASDSLLVSFARTGDLGATGADGGIPYTFATSTTTNADPGAGLWRRNNATFASITELAVSYQSAATGNPSISNFIKTFDDSDSTIKGTLTITKSGAPQNIMVFQVTALNDQTTYGRVAVTPVDSAGSFSASDACLFVFARTGDKGATGATGSQGIQGNPGATGPTGATGATGAAAPLSLDMTWSTGTSGDPGSGATGIDNATYTSMTAWRLSETDRLGSNKSALIASFDDSTSTNKARVDIIDVLDNTKWLSFYITSVVTDAGSYDSFSASYIGAGSALTNGNRVSVIVTPIGNKGTDGLGSGDVVGPASSTNNSLARFDGTTGKLLKDGAVIGTDVQAYSSALASWSGVTRASGFDTFAATPTSANLASLVTDETGTGALVFANSPTLVAPALGTPSSVNLANGTGLPVASGISGLGTGVATALAVNVGSAGAFVTFNGAGGTPSSINLTNGTSLPVSGITPSTSTALGVGSLELGHASDTTLTRLAAGVIGVEGVAVKTAGKETIAIPAGAWKAKASGGATAATYQDIDVFIFNGTTASRIRHAIAMPKSWNESTITFKVFGVVDTGGSSGNVAVFKVAAKAFSHDDVAWTTTDLSTGAQSVTMSWTANDDLLVSTESSALTIDGTPAAGDLIVIELWRDPADAADNNTADFMVASVHIYFTTDAATDA